MLKIDTTIFFFLLTLSKAICQAGKISEITIKYPEAWEATPLPVNISKWTFDEYFKFYPSNIQISKTRENNLLMPFTVQAAQSAWRKKDCDAIKNALLQNQISA